MWQLLPLIYWRAFVLVLLYTNQNPRSPAFVRAAPPLRLANRNRARRVFSLIFIVCLYQRSPREIQRKTAFARFRKSSTPLTKT